MLTTMLRINLVFSVSFFNHFDVSQFLFDKIDRKFLLIFRYYSSESTT